MLAVEPAKIQVRKDVASRVWKSSAENRATESNPAHRVHD